MTGNSYRTVLTLDPDADAVHTADQQFRSWLNEKAKRKSTSITTWDWDGAGVYEVGPGVTLTVVEHTGKDGGVRKRLDLVEAGERESWGTRVTAVSLPAGRDDRQLIMVETRELKHGSKTPGTPKIVRNILSAEDVFDSSVPVKPTPEVIDAGDVHRLLSYVTDPERRVSVVVASPIGRTHTPAWVDAVADLMRDNIGVAAAFVLTPAGLDRLNAVLPDSHSVPIGNVRTFVPKVDLEDPDDGRRHRFLGPQTMAREFHKGKFSNRLKLAHSFSARAHATQATLPASLSRAVKILEREQLAISRDDPALIESPVPDLTAEYAAESAVKAEPAPETVSLAKSVFDRLANLLERVTSKRNIDAESLQILERNVLAAQRSAHVASQQVDDLLDQLAEAQTEREKLAAQLEAEQLERGIAEDARRKAEKQYRTLARWKRDQNNFETVVEDETDWEQSPTTVAELVLRMKDSQFAEVTKYVELTNADANYDYAESIDLRDPVGKFASDFWEYILVLRDYAIAYLDGGFRGGVHSYLTDDSQIGRKCPTVRHKPKESETVGKDKKMRKARSLPVPTVVDPSGSVYMEAHFAPTHRNTTAPRMHYYSDIANTGKIYVGYIGPHLRNTKTN